MASLSYDGGSLNLNISPIIFCRHGGLYLNLADWIFNKNANLESSKRGHLHLSKTFAGDSSFHIEQRLFSLIPNIHIEPHAAELPWGEKTVLTPRYTYT